MIDMVRNSDSNKVDKRESIEAFRGEPLNSKI